MDDKRYAEVEYRDYPEKKPIVGVPDVFEIPPGTAAFSDLGTPQRVEGRTAQNEFFSVDAVTRALSPFPTVQEAQTGGFQFRDAPQPGYKLSREKWDQANAKFKAHYANNPAGALRDVQRTAKHVVRDPAKYNPNRNDFAGLDTRPGYGLGPVKRGRSRKSKSTPPRGPDGKFLSRGGKSKSSTKKQTPKQWYVSKYGEASWKADQRRTAKKTTHKRAEWEKAPKSMDLMRGKRYVDAPNRRR